MLIAEAEALASSLGLTFSASGAASEPGMSLKREEDGSPWSLCRRPWSLMYFTANGRALPCCIAPFSQRGYENYTLGDATQQSLREIWNGDAYADFRDALLSDRAAQGLRQLRAALEPVRWQALPSPLAGEGREGRMRGRAIWSIADAARIGEAPTPRSGRLLARGEGDRLRGAGRPS